MKVCISNLILMLLLFSEATAQQIKRVPLVVTVSGAELSWNQTGTWTVVAKKNDVNKWTRVGDCFGRTVTSCTVPEKGRYRVFSFDKNGPTLRKWVRVEGLEPEDSVHPTITINSFDQSPLAPGLIEISGTSHDDQGIQLNQLSVRNTTEGSTDEGKYWNGFVWGHENSTFSPQGLINWSSSIYLDAGTYSLFGQTRDYSNNETQTDTQILVVAADRINQTEQSNDQIYLSNVLQMTDIGLIEEPAWTREDWEAIFGGDLAFSPKSMSELSLIYDSGVSKIRQRHKANSQGTARVLARYDIPEINNITLRQTIELDSNFTWGTSAFTGKLGFGFGGGAYTTGGDEDNSGFSLRPIWRRGGELAVYSYAANRSGNGSFGEHIGLGWYITPGESFVLEIHAEINSSFAAADGTLSVWVNGELLQKKTVFNGNRSPSVLNLIRTLIGFLTENSTAATVRTTARLQLPGLIISI